MMTDLDLADICAKLYDPAQLSSFIHIFQDHECFAGITYLLGNSVLVYRGSVTPVDWFNDLDETPIDDPQLGAVHGGFFRGVRDWHQRLVAMLSGDVYIVGHSLGAARAFLDGGLMIANGIMPKAIVGFGCPRPGGARLAQLIATCPDARWYRNRHDMVTYVPWRAGEFVHAGEKRLVDAPGALDDPWLFLADHHIALYQKGLAKP